MFSLLRLRESNSNDSRERSSNSNYSNGIKSQEEYVFFTKVLFI